MAKAGKFWSQQTQKEKIESLHIRQQRIVKSLNLLARRYEPDLDVDKETKKYIRNVAKER